MKCPVCKTNDLFMSDRYNVEIDYCPECRGVWLDRGELDKIIERSIPSTSQQVSPETEQPYREYGHSSSHKKKHVYGKSYKKKSFLKDILDF